MLRNAFSLISVMSFALVFAGCGGSDSDGGDASPGGGAAEDGEGGAGAGDGGKGDAVCDLEEDHERWVTQFVLNKHVQSRCSDATGFVATSCCEEEINAYHEASLCPLQSKWNDAEGSGRRCAADDADSEGGAFVPTACCAPLCSDTAKWREQENGTFCTNEGGQFENKVCCALADDEVCAASEYDEFISADQRRHCRDTDTGRFAPAACCIDRCFDVMVAGGEGSILPAACVTAVDDECDGSALNAGGLCHNTDTGKFVKAACCDWELVDLEEVPDVDVAQQASDDAYLCEEVNDDVIRCQTGDDGACDRQGEALQQADFTDNCCAVEQDEPFEYCFE